MMAAWLDTFQSGPLGLFLLAHLPVLPVLLPAFSAMALLLLGDDGGEAHGHVRLTWARRLSLTSLSLGLLLALWLFQRTDAGVLHVYRLGEWPAPFGIVLVVDRLSALMLVLTQAVALPVLWYATGGWDAHGRYFHALFQFQVMGLCGAFVTGDLFNLFVFFEILLIASYVLLVHGQGKERFRVGVQYVVLNLLASALFLIGVSLLYGVTGTLNMADLALRVPQITGAEAVLAQSAALILLVVFGFKAALLPLSLWLPATYAAASAPVAALFAIMTKVGVYAIVRVHGVVFGDGGGESAMVVAPWLLPLAMGTSVLGALGALAARTLPTLVAWLTVASVGTILTAVGLFSVAAWSAAFYYMAHSTLAVAGLFLLVELVSAQRGDVGDRLAPASPVAQPVRLGLMLLLAAASMAGLPPLPGFLGKLMVLMASQGSIAQAWVWSVVLIVGFISLVALARAGSLLFWNVRPDLPSSSSGASAELIIATLSLLVMGVLMSVFAAPLKHFTDAAARQLQDRQAYGHAVLGTDPRTGEVLRTTRPYRMPAAIRPEDRP
ncbi:monovalent cation/H+ antiporter subunit D [Aquabacterium sp.]|uniref:monovalent cation/H+ antiporter subunit D n=1 Tax=Aquabacterium sp. TaxID=1872578 RepID=UPI00248788C3|nr:monovalent cation/H+ antiporter subunit D [Aquabacterium sp.]MDI1260720.1 monovalent cation/H+ antiporter subunit D [Aquabacterium sp.]